MLTKTFDIGDQTPNEKFERLANETVNIRRWESASINEFNKDQWAKVGPSNSINSDLIQDLPNLVNRCRYEALNNPMVEGVINTHTVDLFGETGPSLLVESSDENYNSIFMQVWNGWASKIEVSGLDLLELLTRWNWLDWTTGDNTTQILPDGRDLLGLPASEIISTRLLDIDPVRMESPFFDATNRNVTMGVERDNFGRVLRYHFRKPSEQFSRYDFGLEWTGIVADELIHAFESIEPGQARGFPGLSSSLQEIADLRDFDTQVLDAARTAADSGFLLYSDVTEAASSFVPFSGEVEFKRRNGKALPPGYKAMQLQAGQPTAQYLDYRHDKLRSIGRPKHMPLLLVLLSADKSNFSQSRMDVNVFYERGILNRRSFITRKQLNRLVQIVKRELMLATIPGGGFVLPPEPADVKYSFGWEPISQANPKDSISVTEDKLRLRLTSPEIELKKENKSVQEIADSWERSNKALEAAGAPVIFKGQEKAHVEADSNPDDANQESNDGQQENANRFALAGELLRGGYASN